MRVIFGLTILFVFYICPISAQKDADILMTVGKTAVTVGEFKYIYEKNNGDKADYTSKNLKDYLDLYTNFKLKVEKAKQLRYDTIQELALELQGYRKQLASSYLIDKEVTESLLKELYERTKYDVEFSHIFLPISAEDNAAKKEELKSQMMALKSKIITGQNFEEVAKEFSKDPNSASKGGYMGFINAKLPSGFYQLENALYLTPIDEISDIVESKIGFHIVKVLSKRPARGQVQVAHIYMKKDNKRAKTVMDSLYQELKKGIEFSGLVRQFSDDKNTQNNGGILPPFGINTYDLEFENQAFSLAADGEITMPFQSKSGWHILKRMHRQQPDSYDVFVRKMKSQINKDERFDMAKIALIQDIKNSNGFKEDQAVLKTFIDALQEDFYSYKWNPSLDNPDVRLFTIGNSFSSTLGDFALYVKKNTKTRLKYDKSRPIALTANELYSEFVNEKCIEFEEKNLEQKYPDFKSLMREYEEGILLFEVTKNTVWDKANADSLGLEKFYLSNKMKYVSEEQAKLTTFVIHSMDKKIVDKIYAMAKSKPVEKVLAKFNKEKTLIAITQESMDKSNPALSGIVWKKGALSQMVANDQAKHHSFKKIMEIIPARNKSLSESRGYVVADYQDFLEKEWLKQLREEFIVMLNQPVLNLLIKK